MTYLNIIKLYSTILKKLRAFQFSKLLFTISFLIAFNGTCQKVVFKDKQTNKPIAGVEVESGKFSGISDNSGQLDISKIEGNAQILCLHVNYNPLTIQKSNISTDLIILLDAKSTFLPTIDVKHPLRNKVNVEDVPHEVKIISREEMINEKPQNSADMLQNTGRVFVQKSQGGGGSPVMRGFEANKVLLVVDGVRLNNAIYRSGHLQNALSIDHSVLSHSEIVFGPSSVLYGSDALGGVIHFHTIKPKLSETNKPKINANVSSHFNTNDQSSVNHLNFSVGKKKIGVLLGYTNSNFGNSIIGKNRVHGYNDWGLHTHYAHRINNKDTTLLNPNQNEQLFTGYTQHDLIGKLFYKISNRIDYTFNVQYSTSSNINRYDKLVEMRYGNQRYAEWYYGPQNRFLASFKSNFTINKKWANKATAILAYQKIDEDRISRLFGSAFRTSKLEDVEVYSFNLDLNKIIDDSKVIYYGFESQMNSVKSTAFSQNISSLEKHSAISRYPGLNDYLSTGLYVEYKQHYNPKLLLTAGFRYSLINANSTFNDTTLVVLPFDQIKIRTGAPSGSFGLNFQPDGRTIIKPSISTGFRAPNIDDFGKVFENNGKTIIPNDQLKPEYVFNGEVSVERILGKRRMTLGVTSYYTYLINAIVRKDFSVYGSDSIYYEGELTQIQMNMNTNNAYIYGLNVFTELKITQNIKALLTYNYTKGMDLTDQKPLAHIIPSFGKIDVNYSKNKINTSVYSYYNFNKPIESFGGDSDNIEEATISGTPAWWTLNYKISYDLTKKIKVQLYASNILDYHYRQFSSGISAPGRSFKFGFLGKF